MSKVLAPITHFPFINADELANELWPTEPASHAYEASAMAASQRVEFIKRNRSFITETVFSHASKVELTEMAIDQGYFVELHVILIPEAIAVDRVKSRVARGGHDVPPNKVVTRYRRLFPLIATTLPIVHRATFYDNSSAAQAFRRVAIAENGKWIGKPNWPLWTPDPLKNATT